MFGPLIMTEIATIFEMDRQSKRILFTTSTYLLGFVILLTALLYYTSPAKDITTILLLLVLFWIVLGAYLARRITKRLTHELAVKEAINRELKAERDGATRALASKAHTLAVVSHEFKTPINVIQGFSELCIDQVRQQCSPEVSENLITDLRLIHEAAATLTLQTQQILLSEELEIRGFEKRVEPVSLKKLVSDRIRTLEVSADKKSITLNVNIKGAYPVLANSVALGQAIDNLLSNAIKFSPSDTTVYIHLSPSSGTESVVLSVRDEGPGLKVTELKQLFKPFSRLSARPTSGESSTGLGLSIVKQIIDGHGGKVWCESSYGKGATFFIELRLQI